MGNSNNNLALVSYFVWFVSFSIPLAREFRSCCWLDPLNPPNFGRPAAGPRIAGRSPP